MNIYGMRLTGMRLTEMRLTGMTPHHTIAYQTATNITQLQIISA